MVDQPTIRASDIFTSSSYPDLSLIDRRSFVKDLKLALDTSKSVIVEVSGPSRSGKSVLVERCFRDPTLEKYNRIRMSGNSIKSVEIFLEYLLYLLDPDNKDVEKKYAIEGLLPPFIKTSYERTKKKNAILEIEIIKILRKQPTILFIDDFHWIPPSVRADIIRTIKTLMEIAESNSGAGLRTVTAFVPTREIHKAKIWNEMSSDRVTVIRLPLWEPIELQAIASSRFSEAAGKVLGLLDLAKLCYGLPSIMQSFCLSYCNEFHNGHIPARVRIIVDDNRFPLVLQKVASAAWSVNVMNMYDSLTSGLALKEDWKFQRLDGSFGNINQLILYSLVDTQIPIDEGLKMDTAIEFDIQSIMERIRRVTAPDSLQNINEALVRQSLKHMSDYLENEYLRSIMISKDKEEYQRDPILEYNESRANPTLTIYLPSFLMALRFAPEHKQRWVPWSNQQTP